MAVRPAERTGLAPFLSWPQLYARLIPTREDRPSEFRQGDHVTILGPTDAGKTHIAIEIIELRNYIIFVACKPRDPLIDSLRARGYYVTRTLEIPHVDGRPHYRKVLYWPVFEPERVKSLTVRKQMQSRAVAQVIQYVHDRGFWTLVLDEATWVCRDLNLQRQVDQLLFAARSSKVSVVVVAQRPAWVGRYPLSMATHLLIFQTANREDRKALGEISGVDHKAVAEEIGSLDRVRHEVLYVNTRTQEMFRTIAPAR